MTDPTYVVIGDASRAPVAAFHSLEELRSWILRCGAPSLFHYWRMHDVNPVRLDWLKIIKEG